VPLAAGSSSFLSVFFVSSLSFILNLLVFAGVLMAG